MHPILLGRLIVGGASLVILGGAAYVTGSLAVLALALVPSAVLELVLARTR